MATMPHKAIKSHSGTVQPNRKLPAVEIVSSSQKSAKQVEKVVGYADNAVHAVKVLAGIHAFRVYDATLDLIGRNKIGTFQGLVKSAKCRAVFEISSDMAEKSEVVAFIAGLAANLTEAVPEFEVIRMSKDPISIKGSKVVHLGQKIAARTAVGVITGGVTTIYESLQGWCMIAGLAGGKFQSASQQCVAVLQDANLKVTATGKAIADLSVDLDPRWYVVNLALRKATQP
jgi:hypothetical protein